MRQRTILLVGIGGELELMGTNLLCHSEKDLIFFPLGHTFIDFVICLELY